MSTATRMATLCQMSRSVMARTKWLTYDQVIAIHSRQLRRFGGAAGLRDDGLLRSAIERPVNKWHYEQAELPELAAAYAFGLAKNHAFVDGNKRIAFMSMMAFLRKNGVRFSPSRHMPRRSLCLSPPVKSAKKVLRAGSATTGRRSNGKPRKSHRECNRQPVGSAVHSADCPMGAIIQE